MSIKEKNHSTDSAAMDTNNSVTDKLSESTKQFINM